MQIKSKPMGSYGTNCYIATIDDKDIIIDPGQSATEWVVANVKNPIAILNTHGHFDHVWSNSELKSRLDIPIYCPDEDCFMLESDPFGQGTPPSIPDYRVRGDEDIMLDGIEIGYRHFPGHTPGCSVIEIDGVWFSGDFLFERSIGRWDFPYSSRVDMIRSLQKAQSIDGDYTIYTGHGNPTSLKSEQRYMSYWIEQVKATI